MALQAHLQASVAWHSACKSPRLLRIRWHCSPYWISAQRCCTWRRGSQSYKGSFLSGSLSVQRLLLKQSLSQLKSLMCFWWRNTPVSMATRSTQSSGYLEIRKPELSSQHPLGKLFSFFRSSSHFREENWPPLYVTPGSTMWFSLASE